MGTKGLVTSKMGPTFLLRANAPRYKAGAGAQRIETQDFSLFRAEQHGLLEGNAALLTANFAVVMSKRESRHLLPF